MVSLVSESVCSAPPNGGHRRPIVAWLLLLLLHWGGAASAQEEVGDLVELTLDRLLEAQFIPVGVMGTHIHAKGEWMIGYRAMSMDMEGSRVGGDRVTTQDVLAMFPVTPLRMTTQMHMFELMYGASDRVTLMVMAPYVRKEMDHVTRTGAEFTTVAEGIGDVSVMTHILLGRSGAHWWIFTPGVRIPTGSIDARDATPAGPDEKLPYPMQLGTGSVEAVPMLNYLYQKPKWLFGLHGMAVLSTEENDNGYEVGDRFHATTFLARKVSDAFALSIRIDSSSRDPYQGADPDLNPNVVYTADPSLRGGERVDAALGLNFYATGKRGGTFGHRFVFEAARPISQDLDGPQLEVDLSLVFSWQWTF